MTRRPILVLTALVAVVAVAIIGPDGVGATVPDTSPPSSAADTQPPVTDPPTTMQQATRGSTVQLVPTSPPPTTAAPSTVPPFNPYAVPANSGTGRRAIYSKGRMRVWIVEADGTLVRTYLVSGRFNQPNYGTYSVFSRSAYTCNINHSNVCMRWMVRFAKGPTGDNIGFHEIPRKDGVPVQSDSQLGQALSSGCVRQSTADAWFMWNWAYVGTKVVVIP